MAYKEKSGNGSSEFAHLPHPINVALPLWVSPLGPLINFVAGIRASVRTKLLASFLMGALLVLGMAVLSIIVLGRMNQQVNELAELQKKLDLARQMIYSVTAQSHNRAMALLTVDDFQNVKLANAKKNFQEDLETLERIGIIFPNDPEFFNRVGKANERFGVSGEKVLNLYNAGNIDEALKLHIDEEHRISHEIEEAVQELIANSSNDMVGAAVAYRSDRRLLTRIIWTSSVVSLAGALLLGLVVSWSFIRPVRRIDSVVGAIAGGDFNQRAEVPNRDEFGTLANNINKMSLELANLYTQAEELAAAQERNRLARDLHDSVVQSIFSMTLIIESVRILLQRDSSRVAPYLEKLQELAQRSLDEMRSLIQHLHTSPVGEHGLARALQDHLTALKRRDNLTVDLRIEGDRALQSEQAEGLFRIAQEALNNVIKHAQTDSAKVTLRIEDRQVSLLIEDRGVGFVSSPGESVGEGFGMASMRERAKLLGGTLVVESSPGEGTRVLVEVGQIEREGHG